MESIIKFLPQVLDGLLVTLKIFFVTLIISIPFGVLVALGRLSKVKIIKEIARIYIWIMRGTPLLLQIVFIFFGLPLVGITLERFPSAILAFVLNYAAYFGEIFRAGIQSIDKGQYEGAEVLGLNPVQTFIRIVLPQAFKRILPPVANEVVTLIKDTALVYVVGLEELLIVGKNAVNRDATLIPFIVIAVVYLLLNGVLTVILERIENKFNYYK